MKTIIYTPSNGIRGYMNKVRLRGLNFKPAEAGFVCVAATSGRQVQHLKII